MAATPRIGVDYAGEWAARPWRFVDADSPWLSKKLKPAGAVEVAQMNSRGKPRASISAQSS